MSMHLTNDAEEESLSAVDLLPADVLASEFVPFLPACLVLGLFATLTIFWFLTGFLSLACNISWLSSLYEILMLGSKECKYQQCEAHNYIAVIEAAFQVKYNSQ